MNRGPGATPLDMHQFTFRVNFLPVSFRQPHHALVTPQRFSLTLSLLFRYVRWTKLVSCRVLIKRLHLQFDLIFYLSICLFTSVTY